VASKMLGGVLVSTEMGGDIVSELRTLNRIPTGK